MDSQEDRCFVSCLGGHAHMQICSWKRAAVEADNAWVMLARLCSCKAGFARDGNCIHSGGNGSHHVLVSALSVAMYVCEEFATSFFSEAGFARD